MGACLKQGNTARNAKIQFLKMFFWIPFIEVIFPISRSRRPNSRYRGTATTAIYPCALIRDKIRDKIRDQMRNKIRNNMRDKIRDNIRYTMRQEIRYEIR